MITNNSLMITVNAHHSFKKKRRKRSPFDMHFARALQTVRDGEQTVDEFYSFWEYLNDVARVADKRLMTALMAQLTTLFWHPVVCTALSSPSADLATAATAYTTEMIRSLTDQKLLHAFLVVLIGEEGGIGKDLEPEVRANLSRQDLIEDSDSQRTSDEEEEDEEEDEKDKVTAISSSDEQDTELTLRLVLINRIDAESHDLSLSTLRMFDTILETYNQFAIYNLVLRNYLDITPEGEYVDDMEAKEANAMAAITSAAAAATSDNASVASSSKQSGEDNDDKQSSTSATGSGDNADEKVGELAVAEDVSKKDTKTDKVRWLVER